jgi:hypothetical protein
MTLRLKLRQSRGAHQSYDHYTFGAVENFHIERFVGFALTVQGRRFNGVRLGMNCPLTNARGLVRTPYGRATTQWSFAARTVTPLITIFRKDYVEVGQWMKENTGSLGICICRNSATSATCNRAQTNHLSLRLSGCHLIAMPFYNRTVRIVQRSRQSAYANIVAVGSNAYRN